MPVHNRLSRRAAVVDTDGETVGPVRAREALSHQLNELPDRLYFLGRAVEDALEMPARNDERVAGGDGIAVGNRQGVLVRAEYLSVAQVAERRVGGRSRAGDDIASSSREPSDCLDVDVVGRPRRKQLTASDPRGRFQRILFAKLQSVPAASDEADIGCFERSGYSTEFIAQGVTRHRCTFPL